MTHQELKEEVSKRYPVGTTYTPLGQSGLKSTVEKDWEIRIHISGDGERKASDFVSNKKNEWGESISKGFIFEEGVFSLKTGWAEIIKEQGPVEHLLEEARKKYPVGSTFTPVGSKRQHTVENDWKLRARDGIRGLNIYFVAKEAPLHFIVESALCVYSYGKWAEIINKSEINLNPTRAELEKTSKEDFKDLLRAKYPVGCQFIPNGTSNKSIVTVKSTWKLELHSDKTSAWFINRDGVTAHDGYLYHEDDGFANIILSSEAPVVTKPQLIPVTKYVEALRVQRGPDWDWFNQDGGAGNLGTVVEKGIKGVYVKWDHSSYSPYFYQINDSKYDLALADPNDAHLLEDKPVEVFHNPDKLTPEQVGEGYRLLYLSEVLQRELGYKSINSWIISKKCWNESTYNGNANNVTYRVPACFPKDFTEEYIKDYEKKLEIKSGLTPEETLLEKARRLYPIGTNYIPLSLNGSTYDNVYKSEKLPEQQYNTGDIKCGIGFIYINYLDKWAEIISTPEISKEPTKEEMIAKLTEMYPVGTIYKPVSAVWSVYGEVTVKENWRIKKGMYGYDFIKPDGSVEPGYIYTNKGMYAEIISQPKVEDTSSILKKDDTVVFKGPNCDRKYRVSNNCLVSKGRECNSIIFKDLGVDAAVLAQECYGYVLGRVGAWPFFKYGDYEAVTRLVNKLHELCVQTTAVKPLIGERKYDRKLPVTGCIKTTDSRYKEILDELKATRFRAPKDAKRYPKKEYANFLVWGWDSYYHAKKTSIPEFKPETTSMGDLGDELCKHCPLTCYGPVNTGPHNLCEGSHCEQAYEQYLDDTGGPLGLLGLWRGASKIDYGALFGGGLNKDISGWTKHEEAKKEINQTEIKNFTDIPDEIGQFIKHYDILNCSGNVGILEQITNLSELHSISEVKYLNMSEIAKRYRNSLTDSDKKVINAHAESLLDGEAENITEKVDWDKWYSKFLFKPLDRSKLIKYDPTGKYELLKEKYSYILTNSLSEDSENITNLLTNKQK